MKTPCPVCGHPVQVWPDLSDGLKVNFACDNYDCAAGKGPWDTPRPTPATESAKHLRSLPYDSLGPAARRLRDLWDAQDVSALLADVRNGVYG